MKSGLKTGWIRVFNSILENRTSAALDRLTGLCVGVFSFAYEIALFVIIIDGNTKIGTLFAYYISTAVHGM